MFMPIQVHTPEEGFEIKSVNEALQRNASSDLFTHQELVLF